MRKPGAGGIGKPGPSEATLQAEHTQHGHEHPVLPEQPKDLVFLRLPHTGDKFGLESATPTLRVLSCQGMNCVCTY